MPIDPAVLPSDAEFKGHDPVTVQDLILRTDNVRFLKEKYYSAAQAKTYLAELPKGYAGAFGPGVKSAVLVWYYGMNTSEPKIRELLDHVGIRISEGQLSNLLIHQHDACHQEKDALYTAGLRSSPMSSSGTLVISTLRAIFSKTSGAMARAVREGFLEGGLEPARDDAR